MGWTLGEEGQTLHVPLPLGKQISPKQGKQGCMTGGRESWAIDYFFLPLIGLCDLEQISDPLLAVFFCVKRGGWTR